MIKFFKSKLKQSTDRVRRPKNTTLVMDPIDWTNNAKHLNSILSSGDPLDAQKIRLSYTFQHATNQGELNISRTKILLDKPLNKSQINRIESLGLNYSEQHR